MNLLIIILAGLFTGLVCLICQIILNNTSLTPGHLTTLLVVIGAILEFLNIYEKLKEIFNMGANIVICSFGSTIMKGVKHGVDNEGLLGIFSGAFANCSTILAFAIFLAVLATLFFKPRS